MADARHGASLRVAVLARSAYPLHGLGGLERHVFDLVRHHLADGMSVWLVTRPGEPRDARARDSWAAMTAHPRFSVSFVPYRTFPFAGRRGTTIVDRGTAYPVFGWRAGRLVAKAVAAGRVDVVYALGASAFGYARARRREASATAPLVFNPQGLEEFGGIDGTYAGQLLKRVGYLPLRRVVRASADAADAVIATDHALEPMLERHLSVHAPRLRLVPNGIDVAACDALAGPAEGRALRERLGIPSGDMVLLSVGRIERNKGFHHLAAALAGWASRPGWSWAHAGDGPFARELDETVAHAGLSGRVRRLGRISDQDLHAWYEAADLFVHPTVYEGSSLVTLEAMTHRRPVVGTRAGGLPDKVQPGITGWLVAPGDPAALCGALEDAFAARPGWATMGDAGRALVRAVFDWPVIQQALRAVYEDLLARGRRPAEGSTRRDRA